MSDPGFRAHRAVEKARQASDQGTLAPRQRQPWVTPKLVTVSMVSVTEGGTPGKSIPEGVSSIS
jgi:hypothetical protein